MSSFNKQKFKRIKQLKKNLENKTKKKEAPKPQPKKEKE